MLNLSSLWVKQMRHTIQHVLISDFLFRGACRLILFSLVRARLAVPPFQVFMLSLDNWQLALATYLQYVKVVGIPILSSN